MSRKSVFSPSGKQYRNKESLAKSMYVITRLAQGATIQEVAAELEMTESAVRTRFNTESKEYLSGGLTNLLLKIKVLQSEQLDGIYREAMDAWEFSKGYKDGERTKEGNAKFLAEARGALSDIRRVWNVEKRDIDITDTGEPLATASETPSPATAAKLDQNSIGTVIATLSEIGVLPDSLDREALDHELMSSLEISEPPNPTEIKEDIEFEE